MKAIRYILLVMITISMILSCDFLAETYEYKERSEIFLENIRTHDFDKNVEYLFLDTLKSGSSQEKLKEFSNQLLLDFDQNFKFSFIGSERINNSDFTMLVYQIQNQTHFAGIEIFYDNKSKKISDFQYKEDIKPKPKMLGFWLFAIFSLLIPAFNIYVITLIYRSNEKNKWMKYLAVILLNVTTISYSLANGISFELVSAQFMLGIAYSFSGILGSSWSVAFPIGGLYWFWKLKGKKANIE
jgi:hypothetical protein